MYRQEDVQGCSYRQDPGKGLAVEITRVLVRILRVSSMGQRTGSPIDAIDITQYSSAAATQVQGVRTGCINFVGGYGNALRQTERL